MVQGGAVWKSDLMYGQDLRKFVTPEIVTGTGARHLAGRYASNFRAEKVLLVSDPGVTRTGLVHDIEVSLSLAGVDFSIFSGITPNPRASMVMEGASRYEAEGCSAIIAIGGGSTLDCAKGIGIVSSNHQNILEFEGIDQIPVPAPPLICIPTTSGSSADVSQFAIITDPDRYLKVAIVSKALVPDVSLLDPETLLTLPPHLNLHTGLDALTHGIESFVSDAASPLTDLHSVEAIRLIARFLPKSLENPDDLGYRTGMMFGSLHAGLAFSNASLGAVHAMAHSLGGLLDLPHGMCNALLLPSVIRFNYEASHEKFDQVADIFSKEAGLGRGAGKKHGLLELLDDFYAMIGFSDTLSLHGVKRDDLPALAEKAASDVCMVTNPRIAGIRDLIDIYEYAL